jgi:hypothetical protein
MGSTIEFCVTGQDTDVSRIKSYRRMLIGPWCNQPEEYEGYNGFVGWMSITILRDGRWLLPFSSGYWHLSPPLTPELLQDPENLSFYRDMQKHGMPYVVAPRGGRAHVIVSEDSGATWGTPQPLVDSECDDRHPSILELDDGVLLCGYGQLVMSTPVHSTHCMHSYDGGETWTEPKTVTTTGGGFGANPTIQLSDGSLIWVIDGYHDEGTKESVVGVFGSVDRGQTFEKYAIIDPGYGLFEPSVIELPDKSLMMIGRRMGDLSWSTDGGRSWTSPVALGVEMYDPHLVLLPNGIVACFHGSYQTGGLRVLLSKDYGQTWNGPGEKMGYNVDPTVYGYSAPILLDDGTIYIAYIHSGGHTPADARTQAIWGLRVRVLEDATGVEILPAPGSPFDSGFEDERSGLEMLNTYGGDPELGNLPRA